MSKAFENIFYWDGHKVTILIEAGNPETLPWCLACEQCQMDGEYSPRTCAVDGQKLHWYDGPLRSEACVKAEEAFEKDLMTKTDRAWSKDRWDSDLDLPWDNPIFVSGYHKGMIEGMEKARSILKDGPWTLEDFSDDMGAMFKKHPSFSAVLILFGIVMVGFGYFMGSH